MADERAERMEERLREAVDSLNNAINMLDGLRNDVSADDLRWQLNSASAHVQVGRGVLFRLRPDLQFIDKAGC